MKHGFTLLMVGLLALSVSSPLRMPINRLLLDIANTEHLRPLLRFLVL